MQVTRRWYYCSAGTWTIVDCWY